MPSIADFVNVFVVRFYISFALFFRFLIPGDSGKTQFDDHAGNHGREAGGYPDLHIAS